MRKVRAVLVAGALVAGGLTTIGIVNADAHDLTGASAQATCNENVVTVAWTFVSANAEYHTIQNVTFSRQVDAYSHTTNKVFASTREKAGATVSLRATVTFEDGWQSSYTVTTTIPADVCPVAVAITPPSTTTVAPPPPSVPAPVPSTPTPTVEAAPPPVPQAPVPSVPSSVPTVPDTPKSAPPKASSKPPVALPATL